MWFDFGNFISLSATESYGSAIRKTIYSGVPVWLRFASGLTELIAERSKDGIANLDLDFQATELLRESNYLLNIEIQPLSSKEIIKLQSERIRSLCYSWIALSGDKL